LLLNRRTCSDNCFSIQLYGSTAIEKFQGSQNLDACRWLLPVIHLRYTVNTLNHGPGNSDLDGLKRTWSGEAHPLEMLSCASAKGDWLHVEIWAVDDHALLKIYTDWNRGCGADETQDLRLGSPCYRRKLSVLLSRQDVRERSYDPTDQQA
jgi:hypothetical protein